LLYLGHTKNPDDDDDDDSRTLRYTLTVNPETANLYTCMLDEILHLGKVLADKLKQKRNLLR